MPRAHAESSEPKRGIKPLNYNLMLRGFRCPDLELGRIDVPAAFLLLLYVRQLAV